MTTPRHQVDAIRELGYSDAEAQFLYLVATHAGYFTCSQFLRFMGQTKGQVHRFTTRALRYRHTRAFEYGNNTYIFNLYSRCFYGAIDQENLRNRRRTSNDLILIRLLILDFVLAHRNYEYLETEAQKVAHFHRSLGIPLSVLPGRIYQGLKSTANTQRYFVDRFPIFLAPAASPDPRSPIPTFVYCAPDGKNLAGFLRHLRRYENLLHRLPAFNFIYASATSARFERAAKLFHSRFRQAGPLFLRDLIRYFQIRQLWESHQTGSLTRADRDCLRAGDQRCQGEWFESAYSRWTAGTLSESELDAGLKARGEIVRNNFSSYVLPESYAIFHRRSLSPLRPSVSGSCPMDSPTLVSPAVVPRSSDED
jgi:hypothetical protein